MSPLELLQKLAALVPRPRLNLVRLTNRMFECREAQGSARATHGVLTPNTQTAGTSAKWRLQVVPCGSEPVEHEADRAGEERDNEKKRGAGRYILWSRLLRRVFNLDMECCPNCGGKVKVVAAIEDLGS